MKKALLLGVFLSLSGCGLAYISPDVRQDGPLDVKVVELSPATVRRANASPYTPRSLPAAFYNVAGAAGRPAGGGALPAPVFSAQPPAEVVKAILPPPAKPGPYRIGVSDVITLTTRSSDASVEAQTGLLASQTRRQGYTVQDDGTVTVPEIGRVKVAGLTVEQAQDAIFQRMVQARLDPTLSLEIADFRSQRVVVGGAVQTPTAVPITLTPVTLVDALVAAGGARPEVADYAVLRLFRDGKLYQIALKDLKSGRYEKTRLKDGDIIFVDSTYDLSQAKGYFEQQITLLGLRESSRAAAIKELEGAIARRRAALDEARTNFASQLEYGAVKRDYVYLVGELNNQRRFAMPFGQKAVLADAIFNDGGLALGTANPAQIYILRGARGRDGVVTALHLDARNAANFLLATRLELRPNDVIFVAEQPVTKWNRVVQQLTPSLIVSGANAASKL